MALTEEEARALEYREAARRRVVFRSEVIAPALRGDPVLRAELQRNWQPLADFGLDQQLPPDPDYEDLDSCR